MSSEGISIGQLPALGGLWLQHSDGVQMGRQTMHLLVLMRAF
jgi:hypothetical protein